MGTYSLDFTTATYTKSGTSYALASLPGWSFANSTGGYLLDGSASFAANVPRIKSGTGLLIEPAATNILLYSSDLTNAVWAPLQVTVTGGQTAPDGSSTAFGVGDTVTLNNHALVSSSISISTGQTVTGSAYVKQNLGQYCQILFNCNVSGVGFYVTVDLTNGTITEAVAVGGATISSYAIQSAANGYYRVFVTGACTGATTTQFWVAGTTAATGTGFGPSYLGAYSRYVWQPNVVVGTDRSSPISTAGSTVTRGADVVSLTYSPNDTSTTLNYVGGSATPSASSPINLGSSSAGAWVGSYIQTFTTNSSSTTGAGTVNGVANVAGVSQLVLAGAGAVNGVANISGGSQTFRTAAGTVNGIANISGGSQTFRTAAGTVNGIANVAGASPAAANSGAGTVNGVANVAGASTTTLTAAGAVNGVANVAGAGGVFAPGAGTVNGVANVAGVSGLFLTAAGVVNGTVSVNGVSPAAVTTSVSLTGVVGICTVSSVNVWGAIPEDQVPGWTLVNDSQTPAWTVIPL